MADTVGTVTSLAVADFLRQLQGKPNLPVCKAVTGMC